MCRFLAYKGKRVLLADILTRPCHSLIKQSYRAKMREEPLNGDGFGLGWYDPVFDPFPGLYTSLTPAWADRNLYRIAEKLSSPCIFAHIRAATPGMLVSNVNCHPFKYGPFLWMHNGYIGEFSKIKRLLRNSLKDPFYHMIEGTTDSEHAFAVFLNELPEGRERYTASELTQAMTATILRLNQWAKDAGIKEGSNFNFAVTDGENMVVTRYATPIEKTPESLYYTYGSDFSCTGDTCRMENPLKNKSSIIISSEPVTEEHDNWIEIPSGTLLEVNEKNDLRMINIREEL